MVAILPLRIGCCIPQENGVLPVCHVLNLSSTKLVDSRWLDIALELFLYPAISNLCLANKKIQYVDDFTKYANPLATVDFRRENSSSI